MVLTDQMIQWLDEIQIGTRTGNEHLSVTFMRPATTMVAAAPTPTPTPTPAALIPEEKPQDPKHEEPPNAASEVAPSTKPSKKRKLTELLD